VRFLFADLVLDPDRRELRRGSDLIPVQPQVFDLLLYLVQNRHRVVSKEDLIGTIWEGRVVSESTLTSRINAARKAIGDSGDSQTLIRTIARKGFRFVGTVQAQCGTEGPAGRKDEVPPIATPPPAPSSSTAWKRRRWLTGALVAGLAAVFTYQYVPLTGVARSVFRRAEPPKAISFAPAGRFAVAVLPFKNLSPEKGQEELADGVTEEIISALGRIPNLDVVARGSAFEFKGQNKNVQEIAKALHATHLIEGSIRKIEDRLRITAQLVQADNGVQVWSNSYDRQVANSFAVQEEIAQAIAGALRVPLGLTQGETLVPNRGIDPESYQHFLRAKRMREGRGLTQLPASIALLEQIVARNPKFAPAWAQLALAYQLVPFIPFAQDYETIPVEEKRRTAHQWLPKAEAAARQAVQLDPSLSDGYTALGGVLAFRGRFVEAETLFIKALALDPLSPITLHYYNNLLGAVGRVEESLAIKQRLLKMEPFVYSYNGGIRDLLWINGQTDTLIARLKASRAAIDLAYLARIYWWQGHHQEALDALNAILPESYHGEMVEDAARLLRTSFTDHTPGRNLPQLGRRLDFVYVHVGAPERALQLFADNVAAGFSPPNLMIGLWIPSYATVRKTERFKAFARDAGLVEYWRAKGWPAFCRPTTGEDFVCGCISFPLSHSGRDSRQ
jgi:TolB-like protein/DNA-binding winged helix-turn-helix (wHTH) protein